MKIEYLADELREILQGFADKHDVHIAIESDGGESFCLELNRYERCGSLVLLHEWSTVFASEITPERGECPQCGRRPGYELDCTNDKRESK